MKDKPMNAKLLSLLGALVLIGFGLLDSLYVVRQTELAIIFQFREVVRVVKEPGLNFKVPYLQSVTFFDRRVLAVDAPSQEIMLAEQKPLQVDAFARYRITDPLLYFQRLRSERIANDRLMSLLNATLRSVLGKIKLSALLSEERVGVMTRVTDLLNTEVKDFGVEIVDVRIRRADLPEKTGEAVFARMRSQRQQEAAQIRAEGQQQALETRAEADKQATVLIAEAKGGSEKIKGEGDQQSLNIMAEATNKNPRFFTFWRSMQAYRNGLSSDNTTYILNPEGAFLKYFDKAPPR